MAAKMVELRGTLNPDGTLVLAENPKLSPGPVHVILQSVASQPERGDVIAVLKRIHAEQTARGHRPRSREEIDAEVAAMREEDEERMRAIEQLHEECQRAQKQPTSSEES